MTSGLLLKMHVGEFQDADGMYTICGNLTIDFMLNYYNEQIKYVCYYRVCEEEWEDVSLPLPHCPPGLNCLYDMDQLRVKQKLQLLESHTTGYEINKSYTINDSEHTKLFHVVEVANASCTRYLCDALRPFRMKVLDMESNTVMHLHRPLRCSCCCFPCCMQSIAVEAPPGFRIGGIRQEWSIYRSTFAITDTDGATVLRVEGPMRWMCGDVAFRITTNSGLMVGKIFKQSAGLAADKNTNCFGIHFPMSLDVRLKAVLMGAYFLIVSFGCWVRRGVQVVDMCVGIVSF